MDEIIKYIQATYEPAAIIVYGSYADGTQGIHSDFDAVVLTKNDPRQHDVSVVSGVQLDVFIYPADYFKDESACDEILPVIDGQLVFDAEGAGEALLARVRAYADNIARKSAAEVAEALAWCRKMCERTRRGDTEGLYRHHWLLMESLEIACDALEYPYRGPKKSLRWLEQAHPDVYAVYARALADFSQDALTAWLECLEGLRC